MSLLKNSIAQLATNESFLHHKWYMKYHLEIVENIVSDLSKTFESADNTILDGMVRMHDFPKIINQNQNSEETLQNDGVKFLLNLGFDKDITNKIIDYIIIMDRKENLHNQNIPIEIKIVSTADGLSHILSPFYMIRFYENPNQDIEKLITGNLRKIQIDRDKKIVLDDIKLKYEPNYKAILQQHLFL